MQIPVPPRGRRQGVTVDPAVPSPHAQALEPDAPDQGVPVGYVRRPHRRGHAARQPVEAALRLLRLHAGARAAVPDARRHALGEFAVRHGSGPLAEGRRPGEDHGAQGLGVVRLRLPLSRGARRHGEGIAGRTGPRTTHVARFASERHPNRPAPREGFAPRKPQASRNAGFDYPGRRRTPSRRYQSRSFQPEAVIGAPTEVKHSDQSVFTRVGEKSGLATQAGLGRKECLGRRTELRRSWSWRNVRLALEEVAWWVQRSIFASG